MKRITKHQQKILQEQVEKLCIELGHVPQPTVKPQSFGEMHTEMSMTCSRCGESL